MAVEDVWAEMRAEKPAPALASLGRKSKPATSKSAKSGKATKAKQLDSTMSWATSWGLHVGKQKGEAIPALLEVSEPPETALDRVIEDDVSWSPETFTAAVARDMNLLTEDAVTVRLESLQKIHRVVRPSLPTDVLDAATDVLLKPLLKRLSDSSERAREIAARVVIVLIDGASDREIASSISYVVPVLVSRLACQDIDGISHLPEVMRPKPEQRPSLHHAIESSEEVRLALVELTRSLLQRFIPYPNLLVTYIDEVVGICRAFCMDPFADVKATACENMELLCYNHHEMLLYFAEPLGRSLTSCLVHQHSKIKFFALRALTAVFKCGVWKKNHEVVQHLVAWQDPNMVPVKAFYDPVASTTVNYFSSLTFSQSPAVRRFWFETLGYWILKVEDKVDHEPHIFPYLLSGLFDDNDEIAMEVFWLLEKLGEEVYEVEEAANIRDYKQYGFDYQWTYNGRGFVPFPCCNQWRLRGTKDKPLSPYRRKPQGPDHLGTRSADREAEVDIDLGEPIDIPTRSYAWPLLKDLQVFPTFPRPRLGSRHYVRKHTRRYIKALFNDVVDFRDCTALNAGKLLMVTIAYAEEAIMEWIKDVDDAMVRFYSGKAAMGRSSELIEVYDKCLILLGAYLDPNSLWTQAKPAFTPDSFLNMPQRVAMVEIFTKQLQGAVLVIASLDDDSIRWGRLSKIIPEVLTAMMESDLLYDPQTATRKVLWELLKMLLTDELRPYYTAEQVTQLLCLGLTVAAEPPPELRADFLALKTNAGEVLSQTQWADDAFIAELMALLADIPAAPTAEGGGGILSSCFAAALDFADFSAFRALAAIAPVDVLCAHADAFVARLAAYASEGDNGTRVLTFSVVRQLVDKCTKDGGAAAQALANDALTRCIPPVIHGIRELQTTAVAPSSSTAAKTDLAALDDGDLDDGVVVEGGEENAIDLDDIDLDDGVVVEEVRPLAAATAASAGKIIEAVNMDELDDIDDEPGMVEKVTEKARMIEEDTAHPTDGEEKSALTATKLTPGQELDEDDMDDEPRAPLLVAATPYVVLMSALAVLQQSVRDTPAGFLDLSGWWAPLVGLVGDSGIYVRLRAALEKTERISRGKSLQDDLSMAVEKAIREEAFRRADRLQCSAAATLILAGDRNSWPQDRVDELRPLFGALLPDVDDLDEKFGRGYFVRSLPPSVAMYMGTLLRHTVAAKWRGTTTLRDDAQRAIAQIDLSRTPVSRLRGKPWEEGRESAALEKTIGALLELNLVLPPPDQEAVNVPTKASGLTLGAVEGNGVIPHEVEKLLDENSEALRWNAAFVLYELAIELVRQFTAQAAKLDRKWNEEGMQARNMLLDDITKRGFHQQREKTKFSS
jgi:hypothetical protein